MTILLRLRQAARLIRGSACGGAIIALVALTALAQTPGKNAAAQGPLTGVVERGEGGGAAKSTSDVAASATSVNAGTLDSRHVGSPQSDASFTSEPSLSIGAWSAIGLALLLSVAALCVALFPIVSNYRRHTRHYTHRPVADTALEDVWKRVLHLEQLVAGLTTEMRQLRRVDDQLIETMNGFSERIAGPTERSTRTADERGSEQALIPAYVPVEPRNMAPKVEVIAGVLGQGGSVRPSASHRPMIEVRWRTGAKSAEIWISRDYKFADVTTDYLLNAFELEGVGSGSYETLEPAEVEWGPENMSGRITRRGRARALRS